jgi:methionyl aminopeptidase
VPDIKIKTEAEIRAMKDLGRILADIFKEIERVVREGISTIVIEKKVQECIERFGVKSAFKGYRGYPACTCVSVNEEVQDVLHVILNGSCSSIELFDL